MNLEIGKKFFGILVLVLVLISPSFALDTNSTQQDFKQEKLQTEEIGKQTDINNNQTNTQNSNISNRQEDSSHFGEFIFIAVIVFVILVIITCYLGVKKKLIVYNGKKDFIASFFVVLLPLPLGIILVGVISEQTSYAHYVVYALCIAYVIFVIYNQYITLKSNNYNIIKFLLVNLVKYPLTLLLFIYFLEIFNDKSSEVGANGKPKRKGAGERAQNAFILGLISSLAIALIAEKQK